MSFSNYALTAPVLTWVNREVAQVRHGKGLWTITRLADGKLEVKTRGGLTVHANHRFLKLIEETPYEV